jgi:hypothetical protein
VGRFRACIALRPAPAGGPCAPENLMGARSGDGAHKENPGAYDGIAGLSIARPQPAIRKAERRWGAVAEDCNVTGMLKYGRIRNQRNRAFRKKPSNTTERSAAWHEDRQDGGISFEPRYLGTEEGASMDSEWYYVENVTTIGPTTLADVAEKYRRGGGEPCLVWTEGMSDWADATTVPAISKLHQSKSARPSTVSATHSDETITQYSTLAQRARHELVEYLAISAYLFVCFSASLFYKSAILRSEGIEFTAFGLALVKALILGKFILVLQAIRMDDRGDKRGILLIGILKTSILFLIFLVALNAVEEIALGYFHGRAVHEVLGEMAGGTLPEAIAVCVLLLLVLIPYFSFRGLAARLGDGVLWKHFTDRD